MIAQVQAPQLPSEPYAYTDAQVAEYLQLPLSTVQAMLREGEIPGKKVGRVWRIPVGLFVAWLHDVDQKGA